MRYLALIALAGCSLAGCSDATPAADTPAAIPSAVRPDPAAAARPLSRGERLSRGVEAESSAVAWAAADGSGDGSASCAQATGAAAAFYDAGRRDDAARWQARADSACAALQPQMEATMQRITDSLAAAQGN